MNSMLSVDATGDFCFMGSFGKKIIAVLRDVVDDKLVWKGLFALLLCEVFQSSRDEYFL